MSNFVFEETDSIIGAALFAPYTLPLYPNPLAKIVVEQEFARRVLPVCLMAMGNSIDEEELADVVGGMPTGVQSREEAEVSPSSTQ